MNKFKVVLAALAAAGTAVVASPEPASAGGYGHYRGYHRAAYGYRHHRPFVRRVVVVHRPWHRAYHRPVVRRVVYGYPAYHRRPVVRRVVYRYPAYYHRPVVRRVVYGYPSYYRRPVVRRVVYRSHPRFDHRPYGVRFAAWGHPRHSGWGHHHRRWR